MMKWGLLDLMWGGAVDVQHWVGSSDGFEVFRNSGLTGGNERLLLPGCLDSMESFVGSAAS